MRVVVLGATGNVGTSVLDALAGEPAVQEIVAVACRRAAPSTPRTTVIAADVAHDDLEPIMRGADVVVHLAWLIQPSRNPALMEAVNVRGSERVFAAAVAARVPALVYASSVGAYSPGPKGRLVDERWPTEGIATSFYSANKAAVERLLDRLERDAPAMRVVRMRPGLILSRAAASEVRRLFLGSLVPRAPRAIGLVPDVPRLRFQVVPSREAGEAYRLAILRPIGWPS